MPKLARNLLEGIFLRLRISPRSITTSCSYVLPSIRRVPKENLSKCIALLMRGEGWHNNHHAHQVSARHGSAWYEVNLNYYGISLLESVGLATRVKASGLKSTAESEK
jgi:hypothetical protein